MQSTIGPLRAIALQVAGPERPKQLAPVDVKTPFLIAPDGSINAPEQMLNAFCQRVLPWAIFAEGEAYLVTLAVEGGLYRLDQSIFPGRFEVFGIVFLFAGNASATAQDPRIERIQTDRRVLTDDDGLVVDILASESRGQA